MRTESHPRADIPPIEPLQAIPFPSLRAAPPRKRLWLGAGCVAVFLATLAVASLVHGPGESKGPPGQLPPPTRATRATGAAGLDFIAFYTAGRFVCEGRAGDLYDLSAVRQFQRGLARRDGIELADGVGPWWNPPFYAWVFAPFSRLPFAAATYAWVGVNLACFVAAAGVLCRMLPRGGGWRTWALVPVLMALSTPFLYTISHAQNTCTSLLLLSGVVTAWRGGRGLTAGLVAGLMFYKPQLAAVLAAALVASLGWRAAVGLAVTGSALLAVTLVTLPGTLGAFLHQMPVNLHHVQTHFVYNWERHATLRAFWRLLLQGTAPGEVSGWANAGYALGAAAVAVALVRVSPLDRWINPFGPFGRFGPFARAAAPEGKASRDRFIAAAVAATPLLMPFYFDYDLLLLAVPAVLFAGDLMRRDPGTPLATSDRWLLVLWPVLYGWLMLNADVADHTRVNGAVPLLAGVTSLLVARAARRKTATAAIHGEAPTALARAA